MMSVKNRLSLGARFTFGTALLLSTCFAAVSKTPASYEAGATAQEIPLPDTPHGGNWTILPDSNPAPSLRMGSEEIDRVNWNYLTPNATDSGTEAKGGFGAYRYILSADDITDPAGWTATAVVRVESASDQNLLAAYLRIYDGSYEFLLAFVKDNSTGKEGLILRTKDIEALNDPGQFSGRLIPVDLSSRYVAVQMHYDPAARVVSLYVNGALVTSTAETDFRSSTTTPRIQWGKSTSISSNVRWNKVSFETGRVVVSTAVPYPPTVR